MFKKFSILLVLAVFLVVCAGPPMDEEDVSAALEEMKREIAKYGTKFLPMQIFENEPLKVLGSPKKKKIEKQWVWEYAVTKTTRDGDLCLFKVLVIKSNTPIFEQRFEHKDDPEWLIYPEIHYSTKSRKKKKETHEAFTIYMSDLWLQSPEPPKWQGFSVRLSEHHQVLLDILWYIAKDFERKGE